MASNSSGGFMSGRITRPMVLSRMRAISSPSRVLIGEVPNIEFISGMSATMLSASNAANPKVAAVAAISSARYGRSEEHTSELQSQSNLVCRLLLEKKKKKKKRDKQK